MSASIYLYLRAKRADLRYGDTKSDIGCDMCSWRSVGTRLSVGPSFTLLHVETGLYCPS